MGMEPDAQRASVHPGTRSGSRASTDFGPNTSADPGSDA